MFERILGFFSNIRTKGFQVGLIIKNEENSKITTKIREEAPPQVLTRKEVSLVFSNGYRFMISVEGGKMTISAKSGAKEAFFLDEIPEQFIKELRGLLE